MSFIILSLSVLCDAACNTNSNTCLHDSKRTRTYIEYESNPKDLFQYSTFGSNINNINKCANLNSDYRQNY